MPRRNPWFSAAEQTLPEYVPLPMQELFQAGQVLQNRYDENLANMDAVGTGLASIEARLPGHKEYISNLSSEYRNKTSELLDKYGGNAADPQFQREFSRIKNQFVNDRNLSTILMANEAAKRNEELAARMAAEGRLFVNPRGTGVDAQGNIVNDVGQIRGVNTLDNLANRLKIAAGTKTEVGNIITNRPALEQAQKEIAQSLAMGSPEFVDLKQAYMDRGMSSEQADNQIVQDIQRMAGQYAVSEETNWNKLREARASRSEARENQLHQLRLRAMAKELSEGNGGLNTLKGVPLKGLISATDLNKDKVNLVKNFRKHIGDDGNLNSRSVSPNVLVNPYSPTGATYNDPSGRVYDDKKALEGRTAHETLNYMREELGWGNKRGSAKQVADAYESMIKNDNLVPVVYSPGNSTVRNGLSNVYGSDFTNATYYEDGRAKRLEDTKDIAEAQKNSTLKGITTSNGGSVVFNTTVGDKAITVAVPLDDGARTLLANNLRISGILEAYKDNKDLYRDIKSSPNSFVLRDNDGSLYAPRKTSQGLRYARVNETNDGSVEWDMSDRTLKYLDDNKVRAILHSEYNSIDNLLETLFR